MVVLRRITLAFGLAALLLQRGIVPLDSPLEPILMIAAGVCLYNEIGGLLFERVTSGWLVVVINVQVALDTLALTVLLHYGGGVANPAIVFFAPPFFVYGMVLPFWHAFAHVAITMVELAVLGALERDGLVAHYSIGFFASGAYARENFLWLTIVQVTTVNALCAHLSHHLSGLLCNEEARSRSLATDRGTLLAINEREAARVRALLDVAQHVSGTNSVEQLLRAVCETTVAHVRVPRVGIFLWDAERACIRLAAARGLDVGGPAEDVPRYPADLPMVARLREGELVAFGGAAEDGALAPFASGFAAPMICRGFFEGALFVGCDEERSGELRELVQGVARQAALALVNVRTMERQQEDAEVSRSLLKLSQAVSSCLDEEALWKLLNSRASEVLGMPWSVAARFDERSGTFALAAAEGLPDDVCGALARTCFRLEDFPLLQEILSSREIVVADGLQVRPLPGGWPAGSWVAIPLFRGNWVAGFITVGRFDGGKPFTRRQLRLAEGLGHHGSIALQNARLVADLEAADQLKSEFVSTMSHELRTPLNVIIGYTEILREGAAGAVTSEQRDLIDRLDARGRELLELIEATLHVGRLEAGRDTLEITPLDMPALMQALHASTAGLPCPPGVEFEWDVPSDVPGTMMTDRAKLALVVRNLVSNAFKFTPGGSVVVRLRPSGDTLVVEVQDTGIGIDEEHLPIIFEMFRQVDGSMTRRHGGVGLGLYIVKQFVTRLGGTIDVRSTVGVGSTFRVTLQGVVMTGDVRRRPAAASRAGDGSRVPATSAA